MPTTYNFTVRATDAAGAFADRGFSIDVANTIFDRWAIIGSGGVAFSPDGVTWRQLAGFSGVDVGWGNGVWLIATNTTTLRRSADGLTIESFVPIFQDQSGAGISAQTLRGLRFLNNAWYGWTTNGQLFKSLDNGGTWRRAGPTVSGINLIADLTVLGSRLILIGGSTGSFNSNSLLRWSDTDGATWNVVSGIAQPLASTYGARALLTVGNSVFACTGTANQWLRSFDGANFQIAPVTSGPGDAIGYVNGRLLLFYGVSGVYGVSASTDAGDSATGSGSYALLTSSLAGDYPHRFAASAGRMVQIGTSIRSAAADAPLNGWATLTLSTVGTPYAVAVRV